jgi:hypothetical protein
MASEKFEKGRPSSRTPPSTPPKSPDLSSSQPFTLNDVHQLIDMVQTIMTMKAASSTPTPYCTRCHTPLDDPNSQVSSAAPTHDALEQLSLRLIETMSKLPGSAEVTESVKFDAPGDDQLKPGIVRASKLEFRIVNEVYVSNIKSKKPQLTTS